MDEQRRDFIKKVALGGPALATMGTTLAVQSCAAENVPEGQNAMAATPLQVRKPVVISTWKFGFPANEKAWEILTEGGRALDAVEQGVRVPEDDPNVATVGYGGYPDRDGFVTLDSCIMDELGNCGSVAYLQHIKNPISVARKVMEETPHIMLVGDGALQFALDQGFEKMDLSTEHSKNRWEEWKKEKNYEPVINIENHDTIGMLALDENGDLSGACTTSGLAWKMHGRVGDSPIIGAGLFVDNEVGAATATGKGEAVIKIAGTHLIVELMRQGKSPQEACEEAIQRIIKKQPDHKDFQVGFLALNKQGQYGAYSIQDGFAYNVFYDEEKIHTKSPSALKKK
ncbi:N(4)-(beta-N-acetylglucosaminyl)-L-asparaginase [bacterium SCSIO 12741]|nr:N(4)-(beta-N-acetylglucosaminyl)-L-asparaginase [bacterium SCSIO 12741]